MKMPKSRFCVPVSLGSGCGTATFWSVVAVLLPGRFFVGRRRLRAALDLVESLVIMEGAQPWRRLENEPDDDREAERRGDDEGKDSGAHQQAVAEDRCRGDGERREDAGECEKAAAARAIRLALRELVALPPPGDLVDQGCARVLGAVLVGGLGRHDHSQSEGR